MTKYNAHGILGHYQRESSLPGLIWFAFLVLQAPGWVSVGPVGPDSGAFSICDWALARAVTPAVLPEFLTLILSFLPHFIGSF